MSAVLVQGLFMLIVAPVFSLLVYLLVLILIKAFSLENLFFVVAVLVFMYLVIKQVFSFADIYIEENAIVTERLWYKKKRSFEDFKNVDKAVVLPYTFYIEFKDGKFYYFQLTFKKSINYTFFNDPDQVVRELRKKFINPDMVAEET